MAIVLACSQPPDRIERTPTQSTPTPTPYSDAPTQSTPTSYSDEPFGDWFAIERAPDAHSEMWDAIRVFSHPYDLGLECKEGVDQNGRFIGICVSHLETEGLVSFFYDRGEQGIDVEFLIYQQDSFGVATTAVKCAGTLPSLASLKAQEDTGECEATVYGDIELTRFHTRELMMEWYDAVEGW